MTVQRLTARRRFWLDARLSDRDRLVLDTLSRVRLANGKQLQALCFSGLTDNSAPVVRGRVLARLMRWGLIELVDRRVGGSGNGSSSGVYRLAAAGYAFTESSHARPVRPYTDRFTAHTLAVTQLAAELLDTARQQQVELRQFVTEPASWMPDGVGSYLKPDAYLQLQTPDLTMHWWVEVDLGTESLPALDRKLRTYLQYVGQGLSGPFGTVPRVLITLPSEQRVQSVRDLVSRLPPPAIDLFVPSLSGRAIATLLASLNG